MTQASPALTHALKRCPECSAPNPVANQRCTSCNQVLGSPDKNGIARRPVSWVNYIKAIFWMGIFTSFMWWAFFK